MCIHTHLSLDSPEARFTQIISLSNLNLQHKKSRTSLVLRAFPPNLNLSQIKRVGGRTSAVHPAAEAHVPLRSIWRKCEKH